MDKFIIARQKFQGETLVETDYVTLDTNHGIVTGNDPSAFGSYFGSKDQAKAFRTNYEKHLQAVTDEEGVSYKLRVKAASQAVRDFCSESIYRLEEKDTVTEEVQAAILETIKVEEPEQPAEATVKKAKKSKKVKAEEPAAETEQAAA